MKHEGVTVRRAERTGSAAEHRPTLWSRKSGLRRCPPVREIERVSGAEPEPVRATSQFSAERARLCHTVLTGVSDTAAVALAGVTLRGFTGDGPPLVDAARFGADAVCRTARAARGALPVRDSTPGAAATDAVLLSDGLAEAPLAVGRSTATRGRLAVKVVVGG